MAQWPPPKYATGFKRCFKSHCSPFQCKKTVSEVLKRGIFPIPNFGWQVNGVGGL